MTSWVETRARWPATSRLEDLHTAGGVVIGATVDAAPVALAALDIRPVRSISTLRRLDLLFVGAPYHHRGIGRQLPWRLAERARRAGATGLYVSATPTRNTVDAYRHMGAIVLETPDPALLALEPDGVHLLLPIP